MKCHKHTDREAVGTCIDCQISLCSECSKLFSIPICPGCNLKRLTSDKSEITGTFLKYSIYGIFSAAYVGLYVVPSGIISREFNGEVPLLAIIVGAYFGFLAPYGWAFINGLGSPNTITVRVNESWIAMLMRKVFKFAFSVIIGGFVGPYQIWKMKKRLVEVDEATKLAQAAA